MKKEVSQKILQETERGYDLMAEKFSQTRKHFWRGLEFIRQYAKSGDTVLDFGCGNGRLLELISDVSDIQYLGTDVSQKLVDIAKQHYQKPNVSFSKIAAGQTTLPFADNFFNTIYSIAVFHHFPSKEYRIAVAKEIYRVTKKDGYAVVTVWNLWPASRRQAVSASRGGQKKYIKNIFRNWWEKIFGTSTLGWNDCYISFANNAGEKFQRFHHAFTVNEFKKLFAKAGFSIERCEIVDGRNIILIGKKN